jgi:hypothetical protein
MKNTISDARFLNTLPKKVLRLIEQNPAKWEYAMKLNRELRKEWKYRGETMKPSAFAELTLTTFGSLLDGSLEIPDDSDFTLTPAKASKPAAVKKVSPGLFSLLGVAKRKALTL